MRIVEDTNLPMQQSMLHDYINPDEDWYYKIHVTFIVYDVSMILVRLISFYTFSLQSILLEVRVSYGVHLRASVLCMWFCMQVDRNRDASTDYS
jgi:hypothetical protein